SSRLALPPPEKLREIAAKQDERAKQIKARREQEAERHSSTERSRAAEVIQRNYRGYRARREIKGLGLDPSTRWVEVRNNYSALA
ncbi:hypothetical protein BAUCODRAFT_53278, partial [Baudoinia panamericana UAMH 10762]